MNEKEVTRRAIIGGIGGIGATQLVGHAQGQQAADSERWHHYRKDTRNSGYTPNAVGPKENYSVKWSVEAYAWGPIIHDQSIYYTGRRVRAYDIEDGSDLWVFDPETAQPFVTVVYGSGSIYAVDRSNTLYSISAETGDENWRLDLPFPSGDFVFRSSPQYHDGVIYIRINNIEEANVFAINIDSQELLWQTELPGIGGDNRVRSAPAINDGTVYVGSNALDAQSGEIQWSARNSEVERAADEYYTVSSASVSDDRVYIGYDGGVHAFDANTGQLAWSFGEEAYMSLRGTPAVAGETVYYARNVNTGDSSQGEFNFEGEVVALEAESGDLIWKLPIDNQINGSVIVGNNVAYVGDTGKNLYAINASTGNEIWRLDQTEIIDPGPYTDDYTELALRDDTLYVGTTNSLYALEPGDTTGFTALFRQFSNNSGLLAALVGGGVLGGLALGAYRLTAGSDDESLAQNSAAGPESSVDSDSLVSRETTNDSYPETSFEEYTQNETVFKRTNTKAVRATIDGYSDEVVLYSVTTNSYDTIDTSFLHQFNTKTKTWSSIGDYEYILSVYDHGETPVPWAAIEQIDGKLLINRVDKLSTTEKLELLQQICDALHHVHRYGTIYENLTAESVLYTDNHQVKLRGLLDQFVDPNLWYNAPEEFNGESSEQSAVYRIGLLGYELLTGTLPYEEYPNGDPRTMIRDGKPIPPSEQVSEIGASVDQVLLKALSEDPEVRHETVLHLRDELQKLIDQL